MEGRSTVYNKLTTPEKIANINPENAQLSKDFLEYLASVDRSPQTIEQYSYDLKIFFVFVSERLLHYFTLSFKIFHSFSNKLRQKTIPSKEKLILTRIRGGEPYQTEVFPGMFEPGSRRCPVYGGVRCDGVGIPAS